MHRYFTTAIENLAKYRQVLRTTELNTSLHPSQDQTDNDHRQSSLSEDSEPDENDNEEDSRLLKQNYS